MEKIIYDIDNLPQIAQRLLQKIPSKHLCFYGPMGVGKTTLVKALLQNLGAVDFGNSPTFGLVNEYHDTKGSLLAYHFDFYRIENIEEVYDLGSEDYFTQEVWTFIEWPEKIQTLLPQDHHKVYLQFIDKNTRSIEF